MNVNKTADRLTGWTSQTTQLLQDGGASAWNVIDGAVGEDVCSGVQRELAESKVFDKLLPARTKGEVDADELMTLLMMPANPSFQPTATAISTPRMIRGDKSIFLSREFRSNPSFPERYSNLHHLINVVQNTLIANLSSTMQIDTSQTSVQLAVYPGDGKSGYVRHCDRGEVHCRNEIGDQDGDANDDSAYNSVGRLVTAIYYLTDRDWSATDDGGALRVFDSKGQCNENDIIPYRDRLVVFRADGVEHQVLPSLRRPRTAITMWFYGKRIRVAPSSPSNIAERRLPNKAAPSNQRKTAASNLSSGPTPLQVSPSATVDRDFATIFVAISSYRDSETVPTLQSLFSQAQHPQRIVVGLTLQLDDQEDGDLRTSIQNFSNKYPDQIRCLRMEARDASGPCPARALCQSLHRGEDYVLQIDSHMRLRKNWDSYLVNLHSQIVTKREDNRVLLTTYPVGYALPNTIPNETRGTILVPWKFDDHGILRQRGRLIHPRSEPVTCHLIAAGFFFGPGRVIGEVPYDPTLHQLFLGEELSMAVRFFTHGYQCYAPPETVCYHLWSRAHRPTQRPISSWDKAQRIESLNIVRQQLIGDNAPAGQSSQYGLGKLRSVEDFAKALGVDFTARTFIRDDVENGSLSSHAFVPDQSSAFFPQDSLEHKVATLDLNTRLLISRFLPGGFSMSG